MAYVGLDESLSIQWLGLAAVVAASSCAALLRQPTDSPELEVAVLQTDRP